MKAAVYVTGLGVITAIGNNVAENLRALENSSSGIGPISLFKSHHPLPVGEVKLDNETLLSHTGLPSVSSRNALLGVMAAREAIADSGIEIKRWRTGLIAGTTVGGMDRTEQFFQQFAHDARHGRLRDVVDHTCGSTTSRMAEALGIKTYFSTINTACSSSVNSIIYGSRLINSGMLDVVVAGGNDSMTRFTLNGFNSLMILDKELCRPFDAGRAGLNLGEGGGYVVLVSEQVMREQLKKPYGVIAGYANTNDAFHQTASSPEGRGSFAAMSGALSMAGLEMTDVDYINLHGTGTQNNDSSEGAAVQRLLGDEKVRMSSTKAFTGHTLGASGGIEAVYSLLAIREGCVFPNLRFTEKIPEMKVMPQLTFERNLNIRHVMSNSFGFGGNCTSIIFSAV